MSSSPEAPERDFEFFLEIVDAFKTAGASAPGGDFKNMNVSKFVEAMTMFLRIFDAFANPFFSDVVKKDVSGNIEKLRAGAAKTKCTTIESVIDAECADPKLKKLILKETGQGPETATVGLLWMKRTMQFVIGLLRYLVQDASISLSSASRKSYSETLRYCHNFITRGVFDTGLRFAPTRESFYKNLAGGAEDISKVNAPMKEFLEVFDPQLDSIIAMYKEKGLEPYIK
ncbi:Glycolipid transfer protein [Gracilaria domingensis]|nr:Glycolipid transfer protein [Gracilaria domingensis]